VATRFSWWREDEAVENLAEHHNRHVNCSLEWTKVNHDETLQTPRTGVICQEGHATSSVAALLLIVFGMFPAPFKISYKSTGRDMRETSNSPEKWKMTWFYLNQTSHDFLIEVREVRELRKRTRSSRSSAKFEKFAFFWEVQELQRTSLSSYKTSYFLEGQYITI